MVHTVIPKTTAYLFVLNIIISKLINIFELKLDSEEQLLNFSTNCFKKEHFLLSSNTFQIAYSSSKK